jgi:hypothetical protein
MPGKGIVVLPVKLAGGVVAGVKQGKGLGQPRSRKKEKARNAFMAFSR